MLPIIDLEAFSSGDSKRRRAVAERIGTACESIGFMYVTNHGVAETTIDTAMDAAREFFARPLEQKNLLRRRPGTYRGYIPTIPFSEDLVSGRSFLYEAFIVGEELDAQASNDATGETMRWPNVWPSGDREFRAAITAYYSALTALSEELLRAFALTLGHKENALLACFRRPMTNISLLHYPARQQSAAGSPDNARPHHDTNALTILLPGAAGGLEVEHRELGWTEVPPRPGCFVVNIGNMMETWSGGRFRSTMHRVHPPLGRDRYSIAYFASPDYETLVKPLSPVLRADDMAGCPELHAGREFAAFVAQFDAS